jgi:hypothetical protein
VNVITTGGQVARHTEPGWPLCVDDSLVVQVSWENDTSQIYLAAAEISYRAKPLRGQWGDEATNVTLQDTASANPGHSSTVVYKNASGYYTTLVGYASQNPITWANKSEYKGCTFDRYQVQWSSDYIYISEFGGRRLQNAGTGGAKTGNLVNNGNDELFAAWPYYDSAYVSGSFKHSRTLWYRIRLSSGWQSEHAAFPSDSMYWSHDVCCYADPNHDIQMTYSKSLNDIGYDDSCFNVYWTRYDWSENAFDSSVQLSSATGAQQATLAYVVCEDLGGNEYKLHFVWQEKDGSTFRVKYRSYDHETHELSDIVALDSPGAFYPSVAVCSNGDVWVVWTDRSQNSPTIAWKKASPPNYTWSSKSLFSLEGIADSLMYPVMVADNQGNLHLICAGRSDSTKWDVFYSFNQLRIFWPENLAAIDDVHPKFKWSPSQESNFDHYEICRRHGGNWQSLTTIEGVNDTIYTDTTLWRTYGPSGDKAYYRVLAVDTEEVKSDSSATLTFNLLTGGDAKPVAEIRPTEFALSQNYPNPFNAVTAIEYSLPHEASIWLHIYDIQGRKVATLSDGKRVLPGYHEVKWVAGDLPSGIYFVRLAAGEFVETKRMTLLK